FLQLWNDTARFEDNKILTEVTPLEIKHIGNFSFRWRCWALINENEYCEAPLFLYAVGCECRDYTVPKWQKELTCVKHQTKFNCKNCGKKFLFVNKSGEF